MMIVAQVPVVPRVERDIPAKVIACNIHNVGAVMSVAGYNIIELVCLQQLWTRLKDNERKLRALCVVGSSISMITFVLAGIVYGKSEDLGICCMDKYVDSVQGLAHAYGHDFTNSTYDIDMVHKLHGKFMLSDSAKELGLFIKKTEFW